MSFFNNNGKTIHYRFIDNGSERNLVFINSLGTDFRIWEEVIFLLKDRGNVLLYDKRGHGLSDFSQSSNGLEDYASDIWSLINHFSFKKCIPIGISVGGLIAQLLAKNHPEKIEKLVLCDTAAKIGDDELWNNRIAAVQSKGLSSISGDIMKRWFSASYHERFPESVAGYKNMLDRCTPEGYIQTCEAIRDTDTTEFAENIGLPAICIVGSEDRSTTPQDMRTLSNMMLNSRLEIIQGSAHLPCIDNATAFSKLIIDFLNES